MSKKSTRVKADAVEHWVPGSRDEVNAAIGEIGALHRKRQRLEAGMNDTLAKVKATFEDQAKPLGEQIAEKMRGVHLWCEANRATLTRDGRVKFHDFATGQVRWRFAPWSVSISKAAELVKRLKDDYQGKYLRTKEEIDKTKLLADRESLDKPIKGVTFKQKEEFAVVPHESKIEEVQS
ncbi:host-nuclease inhibitor Gam family protein [Lysobacter sp. CA199]|uniref:host-nuclease inhibitor Gam family protein n=1 Tax=Lysobacter sp. CA199 TaxID=3455608 RepID=UPI003F8D0B48